MDKLNISIIGCGFTGEKHFLALQELSDRANVIAVVDTDEPLLKERANDWSILVHYTDYRDVLSRDDIDAVSICLP